MTSLLELRHVSQAFGGVHALKDVTLELSPGQVVGLIGPNGAGKTTLVNVVTGVHRASGGDILFAGRRITGWSPYQIARLGIARTFQIVQPFPQMTVLDNVAAGALFAARAPSLTAARAEAFDHLRFVGLEHRAAAPATTLPLADRKRLELAKSLAMKPTLLLLDEVNAGMSPADIDRALRLLHRLSERGVTILLIEHIMKIVMAECSRIVVLHHGEVIADGTPGEISRDKRVVEAYLGARWAARERALGW